MKEPASDQMDLDEDELAASEVIVRSFTALH